jgi:hypothetical protein
MAEPGPPIDRRPVPPSAWEAVVIMGGVFLLVAATILGISLLSPSTRSAGRAKSGQTLTDAYVGSQKCSVCHPGEAASHSRSGHARTLRRVAQVPLAKRLDGVTFADPEYRGVTWSYAFRAGKFSTERRDAGQVERFVIDYAFGSGHHATTFATLTDHAPDHPKMIEHRMTVFAHKVLPDVTPGQGLGGNPEGQGPSGRRYSTANTLKCFECHTTTTSNRGPLVLDEATMFPNVGCERCHGPGRSHVEAARGGAADAALSMPFGPGRSTAAEQLRMCGACHRLPEMGDPALVRTDNPVLARFQPVGLMQSACYQKSQGAMSCTTCHDAHARTSTDRAAYEAVCLSCHQGPSQTPCKVSPATGCVGCHMPRRDVSRGMMMTDHWIRSWPEAAANTSTRAGDLSSTNQAGSAPARGL